MLDEALPPPLPRLLPLLLLLPPPLPLPPLLRRLPKLPAPGEAIMALSESDCGNDMALGPGNAAVEAGGAIEPGAAAGGAGGESERRSMGTEA